MASRSEEIDNTGFDVDPEAQVFARLERRIRGAITHPPASLKRRPYLVTYAEDFWERHLQDLVNDGIELGLGRIAGLRPITEILNQAFSPFSVQLQGYLDLSAYANNLALKRWRPSKEPVQSKISALAQLHARSLVLLEETFTLIYGGFPSGAEAHSRTLHEVAITAKFLHRFQAALSERYLDSHIVEMWQTKSNFIPQRRAAHPEQWRDLEIALDAQYSEVIAKHGESMTIPNGWAWPHFDDKPPGRKRLPRRIAFAQLQKAVGRSGQRDRYRSSSQYVHADHLGTVRTFASTRPGVITIGPRPFGFAVAAHSALADVHDISESLLRACGRIADDQAIYYWLEALNQTSLQMQIRIQDLSDALDPMFSNGEAGRFSF